MSLEIAKPLKVIFICSAIYWFFSATCLVFIDRDIHEAFKTHDCFILQSGKVAGLVLDVHESDFPHVLGVDEGQFQVRSRVTALEGALDDNRRTELSKGGRRVVNLA